jgi:hypothetical protein
MSIISSQYSKEIDSLRRQLIEAQDAVDAHERTRMMTQEHLKKAFMKGVCAMNMEAMTILNPNDMSSMERKFESLAENVFSESTPIRQLAFNNSNSSDYRVYDSNLKDEEIYKKFGMQPSESADSDHSVIEDSVHHTPNERQRTQENEFSEEKEIKPFRNAYTELETASVSKPYIQSSGVKISRPGDDIIINNTKIESKDNAWKPAPMMNTQPTIVNNIHHFDSFEHRPQTGTSLNPNNMVPKHTLGMINASMSMNYQALQRGKNNNLDLLETLTPQPHPHPGNGIGNFTQISNEKVQVVKENVSSNVLDRLPGTSLPTVMQKSTTSQGGKTIRVGNK